jgi:hypothetical protein
MKLVTLEGGRVVQHHAARDHQGGRQPLQGRGLRLCESRAEHQRRRGQEGGGPHLEIDKGKKVRFGRIRVVGNTRTRDKVIRREMRIYEGEWYSSAGIKRSKQLITAPRLLRDRRDPHEPRRHRRHDGRRRRGQGEADRHVPGRRRLQLPRELHGPGADLAEQPVWPRPEPLAAGDALQAAHHRQIQFADDYLLDTGSASPRTSTAIENNYEDFTLERSAVTSPSATR